MRHFKSILVVIITMMIFTEFAQAQKLAAVDPSPADIVYLRADGKRSAPVIKIIYGRPSKKGRTMIGGTEAFGTVWRLGANETTEIKLYKDVTFGDTKVAAGTYSLYAIPDKDQWTIIVNSKLDTWGAYEYDQTKDVARFKAPATKSASEVETFTIALEGEKGTGTMFIAWENTLVTVPVKY